MPSTTLFARKGAPVLIHRVGRSVPCPCRTPEGYRDPIWHLNNPSQPVCNDAGYLDVPVEAIVNGFVQPVFAVRRIGNQVLQNAFGQLQQDDHIGMFPMDWNGNVVNFDDWSQSGDEWVEYNDYRFTVVGWTRIPDPANAAFFHHWECALRRID